MKKTVISIFIPLTALLLSGCNLLPQKKTSSSSSPTDTSVDPDNPGDVTGDVPEEGEIPEDEPDVPISEDATKYYETISNEETGAALLKSLNTLNTQKRKKVMTYGGLKTAFKYTEVDPKGTTPDGKMYGFYDNAVINNYWDSELTWNREHVWPRSLGGDKIDGDILMTRPTSKKINSERGNKVYGESSECYDPGKFIAEYRGVAARIILYGAIADTSLKVEDVTTGGTNTMGVLSDLLKWNLEYLPGGKESESLALRIEYNRNEVNATNPELQGNRNPFVDHPEYACRIWGTKNVATRKVCKIS